MSYKKYCKEIWLESKKGSEINFYFLFSIHEINYYVQDTGY